MNIKLQYKGKMFILFPTITLVIFYFSWIPDSNLKSETYLPLWLLNWANSYFNLRTAVPFVALGFLLDAYNSKKSSDKKRRSRAGVWFSNSVIALFVICLAEGGQFFVLDRHPDLADVLFGFVGSQLGFLLYYIYAFQLHRFYSKR
jgi:glycopeptide antibiotics resistance protein